MYYVSLNLFQEAIEEKKSIAEQFTNVYHRRVALDAANLPLIEKRVELDAQISDWQSGQEDVKVNDISRVLRDILTI